MKMQTKSISQEEAQRDWYVIDASGLVLGRLCSHVANILRGKTKPTFTPHADTGADPHADSAAVQRRRGHRERL